MVIEPGCLISEQAARFVGGDLSGRMTETSRSQQHGDAVADLRDGHGRGPLFHPLSFSGQKPRGDEREYLMVMPAQPRANFVVRQARLALASLDRPLDAMGRERDAGELFDRRLAGGVREVEVVLGRPFVVERANDHEDFFVLHDPPVDLGSDATDRNLDGERIFVSVANVDPRPGLGAQLVAPAVDTLEGLFRMDAATAVGGRRHVEIADQRFGRNGQQVALASRVQISAKRGGAPHFVVPGHPRVRQQGALFGEHLERLGVVSLKAHFLRVIRRFAPRSVLGPFLRQIQSSVYQDVVDPRHVGHVDGDLAVVDLAQTATPLAGHAHRLLALLGKRRRIKHDHAIVFAKFRADLPSQLRHQRRVVPRGAAHEVLQRVALLVVAVRNRLHVLALQIRQQAADVVRRVTPLRRLIQQPPERLDEPCQPLRDPRKYLRRHFAFRQHRRLPQGKTSVHDSDLLNKSVFRKFNTKITYLPLRGF